MQFKTFESRRVTLKKASKKAKQEYKSQVILHDVEQDKLNIFESSDTGYLKIENEDGKMLGLIQINEIDSNTIHVKISIPNKCWQIKYGTEALHQFIKCCEERKLYKRIYLKKDNEIIQRYKKERPDMLSEDYYIDLKIA